MTELGAFTETPPTESEIAAWRERMAKSAAALQAHEDEQRAHVAFWISGHIRTERENHSVWTPTTYRPINRGSRKKREGYADEP